MNYCRAFVWSRLAVELFLAWLFSEGLQSAGLWLILCTDCGPFNGAVQNLVLNVELRENCTAVYWCALTPKRTNLIYHILKIWFRQDQFSYHQDQWRTLRVSMKSKLNQTKDSHHMADSIVLKWTCPPNFGPLGFSKVNVACAYSLISSLISLMWFFVQGPVEEWMLMESHDSTEAVGVAGMLNPYA